MFCPKCGSILIPKKEGKKTVVQCSCGYRSGKGEDFSLSEQVKNVSLPVEIVDAKHELDALPSINAHCPKCKNTRAKFWTVQTRAGDEPETKFLKCEKCGHTWRDYN